METLNTPHEIDLYIRVAAARYAYGPYPDAAGIALLADTAVLELRKRIPALATPVDDVEESALDTQLRALRGTGKRVRVTFGNGDTREGVISTESYGVSDWTIIPDGATNSNDWEYFGTNEGYCLVERMVSVEILPTPDLDEQLRLAAERGQRVRATMADGAEHVGMPLWRPDFTGDTMPARVEGQWCGAAESDDEYRVVSVEILDT